MDMDTISSGEPTLLVISGADHFSRTTDGPGGFVSSFLRSFFHRITNRDKVTNQDKVERRNINERSNSSSSDGGDDGDEEDHVHRWNLTTKYYTAMINVNVEKLKVGLEAQQNGKSSDGTTTNQSNVVAVVVIAPMGNEEASHEHIDTAKRLLAQHANNADVRIFAGDESDVASPDSDAFLKRARACEDWCFENGCEYVRVHVQDESRDQELREFGGDNDDDDDDDGCTMHQGANRIRDALECCAWPNMVPVQQQRAAPAPSPELTSASAGAAVNGAPWHPESLLPRCPFGDDEEDSATALLDAEADALDRVFHALAQSRQDGGSGEIPDDWTTFQGAEDSADGAFTAADEARRQRAEQVAMQMMNLFGIQGDDKDDDNNNNNNNNNNEESA